MQRENGNIIIWSSEQGSGLIRPTNGSKDVYLYAINMRIMKRSPRAHDHVTYLLDDADTDKPIARDVVTCTFAWFFFALLCFSVMPLIGLYLYAVRQHLVRYNPAVLVYGCVSLVTILVFHHDKHAEAAGAWRVHNKDLHLLELFGGWPGSLLSQLCFRHKLRNLSYQLVFWLIVIGHVLAWVFIIYGTSLCQFAEERFSKTAYGHVGELMTPVTRTGTLVTPTPELIPPKLGPVVAPVVAPAPLPVAVPVAAPVPEPVALPAPEPAPQPPVVAALTNDTPSVAPLVIDSTASRTLVVAPTQLRRLTGEVKTISPSLGILVSLPWEVGAYGIIAPSTLVADFSARFREGETVTVAVRRVIIKGGHKQVELLLVEP